MPDDPILPIDHPLLSRPSATVDAFGPNLAALVAEMFRILDREQGAGLAAVQIGVAKRVVVLDMPDASGERHRFAMVNPRITALSDRVVTGSEGCLSMPDYWMDIPRRDLAQVAYQDCDGEEQSLVATGPLAVGVQHEVDHTQGVLFYDHASRLKRDRAKSYFRKVRRAHERATKGL